MELAELDDDGYPTEESLELITGWEPGKGETFDDLMEFVAPIFADYGSFVKERDGRTYEITTGGWSGCEEAIAALLSNWFFWSLCWLEHKRGGYYKFTIPPIVKG